MFDIVEETWQIQTMKKSDSFKPKLLFQFISFLAVYLLATNQII